MDEINYLIAHIKDLARKSSKEGIMTSTSFLSLSEQSEINKVLPSLNKEYLNELSFILDGGKRENSDRKILFIVPLFLNEYFEEFKKERISLLHLTPKNAKYSEKLTHRDYLGALMNLGYKREKIGDIIVNFENQNEAIIYLDSVIKDTVINELVSVKHTSLKIKEIELNNPPFSPHFEYISIYISSLRLDNVIKETFKLAREVAKVLIEKEFVCVNGLTQSSPSYQLKKNDRVSVKSKGKFIFLDETNINKKGKYHTIIKKYS